MSLLGATGKSVHRFGLAVVVLFWRSAGPSRRLSSLSNRAASRWFSWVSKSAANPNLFGKG